MKDNFLWVTFGLALLLAVFVVSAFPRLLYASHLTASQCPGGFQQEERCRNEPAGTQHHVCCRAGDRVAAGSCQLNGTWAGGSCVDANPSYGSPYGTPVAVPTNTPTPIASPTNVSCAPTPNNTGIHTCRWSAVTGAISYNIRRSSDNGSSWSAGVPETTTTSWQQPSGLSTGRYIYSVRANGPSGNNSAWSASSNSVIVDKIAPSASSFSVTPQYPTWVNTLDYHSKVLIRATVTDSGGSFLKQWEVWRLYDRDGDGIAEPDAADGEWFKIYTIDAPANSNGSWSPSFEDTPSNGTYWYGMHVIDNARGVGFEPPPGSIKVRVDVTNPTVTNFSVFPTHPAWANIQNPTVTIRWTVRDEGGSRLKKVDIYRSPFNTRGCNDTDKTGCPFTDLIRTANPPPNNPDPWESSITDTPPDGVYWYLRVVYDNADNLAERISIKAQVDKTAPTVSITAPTRIANPQATILQGRCTPSDGNVTVVIAGISTSPLTCFNTGYWYTTVDLSDNTKYPTGNLPVFAQQTDAAGNTSIARDDMEKVAPIPTPTRIPSPTPTRTPTPSKTPTPTPTITPSPTATNTPTPTPSPTNIPTPTATNTPTPTLIPTGVPTPTITPTPTNTPTPSPTPIPTRTISGGVFDIININGTPTPRGINGVVASVFSSNGTTCSNDVIRSQTTANSGTFSLNFDEGTKFCLKTPASLASYNGPFTLEGTAFREGYVNQEATTLSSSNCGTSCNFYYHKSCDGNDNGALDSGDLNDVWIKEFLHQILSKKSDCNNDGIVELLDFNLLKRRLYGQ